LALPSGISIFLLFMTQVERMQFGEKIYAAGLMRSMIE
jgi:hypothetical protein